MGNAVKTLKATDWSATIITLLLRGVASGVVWGCIAFYMSIVDKNAPLNPVGAFFLMLVGVPILALVFLPVALVASALARIGVPFIGLFTIPAMFMLVPGDPLLFIVDKMTSLVPLKNFGFINFHFLILALNDETDVQEVIATEAEIEDSAPCPYTGTVLVTHKDAAGMLGITWDTQEITLEIRDDWRIYRHIVGDVVGFVDEQGGLHKGGLNLDGSATPKATLTGELFARIQGEAIYDLKNNKIADFRPEPAC